MSASAPASTRDAVLSLLLERGEEDAGTLADAVGISVQAMRRHLRSLADSGLVCASSNASGPGRPSNRWCLTDEGRAQFPDGSGRFALGLLDSMRSHLPEATVRQLLNQQAESKASQYRQSLGEASLGGSPRTPGTAAARRGLCDRLQPGRRRRELAARGGPLFSAAHC